MLGERCIIDWLLRSGLGLMHVFSPPNSLAPGRSSKPQSVEKLNQENLDMSRGPPAPKNKKPTLPQPSTTTPARNALDQVIKSSGRRTQSLAKRRLANGLGSMHPIRAFHAVHQGLDGISLGGGPKTKKCRAPGLRAHADRSRDKARPGLACRPGKSSSGDMGLGGGNRRSARCVCVCSL